VIHSLIFMISLKGMKIVGEEADSYMVYFFQITMECMWTILSFSMKWDQYLFELQYGPQFQ
jgi:hypothetical protein